MKKFASLKRRLEKNSIQHQIHDMLTFFNYHPPESYAPQNITHAMPFVHGLRRAYNHLFLHLRDKSHQHTPYAIIAALANSLFFLFCIIRLLGLDIHKIWQLAQLTWQTASITVKDRNGLPFLGQNAQNAITDLAKRKYYTDATTEEMLYFWPRTDFKVTALNEKNEWVSGYYMNITTPMIVASNGGTHMIQPNSIILGDILDIVE